MQKGSERGGELNKEREREKKEREGERERILLSFDQIKCLLNDICLLITI